MKKGELLGVESGVKIMIDDKIVSKISVTEDLIGKIDIGTPGEIYVPSINKYFNFRVVEINQELDKSSSTYPVTLEITDKIEGVRAGMYAEVNLNIGNIKDQILVTNSTPILEGEKAYIYKLTGNNEVKKVIVEKGIEIDGNVQITGDIVFGERVVTKGQHFINEKSKVQVSGSKN